MFHFNQLQFNLEQIKALVAIVDCGGYSKAAQNLNRSHSSLIYSIKGLEEQLKVEIFNREAYRNKLTPAGEKIYLKCRDLLKSAQELSQMGPQFQQEYESKLKIVVDGILPIEPFLKIYHQFQQKNIPTVVQIYTDYLIDVEASSQTLEADIMISVVPLQKYKSWSIDHLPGFKSLLVAHKDHELHQSKKKWKLEELKKFHFLTIRNSGYQMGLNTQELEEQSSFFLSDFHFKKLAIVKKIGFGWLPEHLIENELSHGLLAPIRWERANQHKIQPYLYMRSNSLIHKAQDQIKEILLQ